jgi:hypothetical protein
MNWSANEIKPKRNNKSTYLPTIEDIYYWTYCEGWRRDHFPFVFGTTWFIDIPGAPDELKPLAYPENKPKEDGRYLFHNRHLDSWDVFYHGFHVRGMYEANFDWFIPYNLEEKMEKLPSTLWENDNDYLDTSRIRDGLVLAISKDAVFIPNHIVGEIANAMLKHHAAITPPKPELKACPVCGGKIEVYEEYIDAWVSYCCKCHIHSPVQPSEIMAIKFMNDLPRKGEG